VTPKRSCRQQAAQHRGPRSRRWKGSRSRLEHLAATGVGTERPASPVSAQPIADHLLTLAGATRPGAAVALELPGTLERAPVAATCATPFNPTIASRDISSRLSLRACGPRAFGTLVESFLISTAAPKLNVRRGSKTDAQRMSGMGGKRTFRSGGLNVHFRGFSAPGEPGNQALRLTRISAHHPGWGNTSDLPTEWRGSVLLMYKMPG